MITYELAKKLRESGFPLECCSVFIFKNGEPEGFNPAVYHEEGIYGPALSELIEALGDETVILKYFTSKIGDGKRIANAECKGFCKTGSTLGEAVTNLWLALNNK